MATALLPPRLPAGAAAPLPAIVRAAASVPLDTRTPCTGWNLGALVRHQLYWAPLLAAAGRRTDPVPLAAEESAVPLDGWPAALRAAHADVVDAWSDPAAWTGSTSLAGPQPLPAGMIGEMVVGELVVHGWDLARTAGVDRTMDPGWSDEVLEPLLVALVGMAQQGQDMGLFAPPVPVPADAPLLDRVVAVTGRDPRRTG